MKFAKPEGILFDFGGTLVSTKFDQKRGIEGLLELLEESGNLTYEYVKQVCDELSEAANQCKIDGQIDLRRSQFDRNLFDRLGITIDQTEVELDREFLQNFVEHTPLPGVFEMLDVLESLGIKCGIVSNATIGGEAKDELFDNLGLLKYFRFVMSSADYGFRKPHPQLFKTALAKLGTDPEKTWFIGDIYDIDVVGAEGAGLTGFLYNPSFEDSKDAANLNVIRSWKEFTENIASRWL